MTSCLFKKSILKFGLIAILLLLSGFVLPKPKKITVYLIGDSTVADKEVKAYPETGWGMPFHYFFDSGVTVDNRAKNGRSTRTFIEQGRWKPVYDHLKPGDYVLIQFGHNDEVKTKRSYTTPDHFVDYLVKFVTETRQKKAHPVLITPVARRRFNSSGRAYDTHTVYAPLVRKVARQYHVSLIDLDKTSLQLLQKFGLEKSAYLYNHLTPGENPHYPNGRKDNTHFSELGARRMAELVIDGIKKLHLGLAQRIRKVSSKPK